MLNLSSYSCSMYIKVILTVLNVCSSNLALIPKMNPNELALKR